MYWEQIAFCIFAAGYIMLSTVKTIDRYRAMLHKQHVEKKVQRRQHKIAEASKNSLVPHEVPKTMPKDPIEEELDREDRERAEKKAMIRAKYRFIKTLINYAVTFNSAFLIVGSLSEAYLYGVRMVGNIISVLLGYVYAFTVVQPFMYSLEQDIKTPYQYFSKRYRSSKFVKVITTIAGMLFYFSFLTLYLWGCAVLLSTLIPHAPLWSSSVIIGAFSVLGSTMGGFTQSTKTNLFQFLILISGLVCCIYFTIVKHSQLSFKQMWALAERNERTVFWDLHVDTSTRYTILNQVTSLSMPWTAIHSLLLPNFMRYRAIKNAPTKSRFLMISNFPFMIIVNLLILVPGGILMYIYFFGCNPLYSRKIVNKNQLGTYWAYLVLSEHLPGFCGIFFASIITYSVVQHSLGISLLANTIYNEVLVPVLCPNVTFTHYVKNKIVLGLTLFFGALSILYSISFAYVKNTMISLFFLFNNSINSPILGLYFLSAFNPYANAVGAMLGFISNYGINFFMGLGALLFSRLKSQEFPPDTFLCEHNYHKNMSSLNVYDISNPLHHHLNSTHTSDLYPKDPTLAFFYSVAPIWYCIFSVLYTFTSGSLFSLAYSYVKTRTIDADADFAEERKKYLYYYRIWIKKWPKKEEDEDIQKEKI